MRKKESPTSHEIVTPTALHLEDPPAPHTTTGDRTRRLMVDVLVAVLPALLFAGFYYFGPRVFVLTALSVAACLGFEALCCLAMHRPVSIGDGSAAVTGVLLVLTLPAGAPYWLVVVGDFFAIVVVKSLFGGLGKNFLNPALAARMFLYSFPALMVAWPAVRVWPALWGGADAVTAATPMAALQTGTLPAATLQEMLAGIRGGAIGEVSAALVILGGLYLLVRRVISPCIPLSFLGTVAVLTFLFPKAGVAPMDWMLYQLLGGGVLLGAFFFASDPVTSPVTRQGQVLYGLGCGALTVLLRYFGAYAEGVGGAILLMNACTWFFDRAGKPVRLGAKRWSLWKGGEP